jgi:hypothetical protein
MSDKTNEEKLRILQERLSSIQQKKEVKQEERIQQNKPVSPVFEEDLVSEQKPDTDSSKKKGSAWKIIFFLILFAFSGGFGYYFYDNDFEMEPTIDSIKEDFNDMYVSLFDEEEEEDDKEKKKKKKKVIYEKSEFDGKNFIIVLSTFDEGKKEVADDEVNKLTEMGYNCGVFLLAAVSNSEEEIFQTYIGPFNTENEANQYLDNQSISKYDDRQIIELQ